MSHVTDWTLRQEHIMVQSGDKDTSILYCKVETKTQISILKSYRVEKSDNTKNQTTKRPSENNDSCIQSIIKVK